MKSKLFTLLIVASLLAIMISCGETNRNNEPQKKIAITGSAEMEIVPDEIYMTFTLKEYLNAAKQKVKIENIKADFIKLCKSSGVADSNISISSYTGNERWDYYWYKRRKREPDFMSSISYAVQVSSPEKLDKIVSGLNENALDNFYISKTSHSQIEQLRKEVKTKALIASKAKAEYLAKSINEELGEALLIQEVEENNNFYYANERSNSNMISQTSLSFDGDNTSTPNFKKIKLRYEMKVEFKLK